MYLWSQMSLTFGFKLESFENLLHNKLVSNVWILGQSYICICILVAGKCELCASEVSSCVFGYFVFVCTPNLMELRTDVFGVFDLFPGAFGSFFYVSLHDCIHFVKLLIGLVLGSHM